MNRPFSDDEIVERLKSADTVPEPSPLFWEHAARRVRAAVDAESPRRSVWAGRLAWMGSGLAAAAMAALFVLPHSPVPTRVPAVAPGQTVAEIGTLDEDSWTFVAALGGDLDMETAAGAGLLAPGETTDRVVQALDADERAEVATLLQSALAGSEI
jgi:hypothetical protein